MDKKKSLQEMKKTLFFLLFFFYTFSIYAIDTLRIDEAFDHVRESSFCWLYVDEHHENNFEKIDNLSDSFFLPIKKTGIYFPAKKQVYWLKFHLYNASDTIQQLMLEIQNPVLNIVQATIKDDDGKRKVSKLIGDEYPFQKRIIKHRHLVFPINIGVSSTLTVYVFVDSYGEASRLPLVLSTKKVFEENDKKESFFFSTYIGFTICICLLSFIVALIVKRRLFAYFTLYIISISMLMISLTGYGFQYIWGSIPFFNDASGYFFTCLACICLLALTRRYFETKQTIPKIDHVTHLVQWLLFGFAIYMFFYRNFLDTYNPLMVKLGMVVFLSFLILVIGISYQSFYKTQNRDHLLFLSGFLFVLLNGVIHFFQNFGWVGFQIPMVLTMILGFTIDIGILFFILGNHIRLAILKNLTLSNTVNKLKLEAASALFHGQQGERQRLSQELHDGISLRMATLKMRFSNLIPFLKTQENKKEVNSLLNEMGIISEEVRNFTHALAPLNLTELTLMEAIEDLIYVIEKANPKLLMELDAIAFETAQLSDIQQHALYQTIQELLNNVLKHAEASVVKIKLKQESNVAFLEVIDNGNGFDVQENKPGIGLENIKSRAVFLNGEFKYSSNEKGSKFNFYFPLES